ncbi:MAG: bifunctional glutamate N-acetyltransferase/amino-acid acetyltransferase ArgJ [Candidatus Anammoxibacter sp.]
MSDINIINDPTGAIVMPEGFKAGAAYCGLKSDKQGFDVGVIYSESSCVAASVFTINRITAAPIQFCKKTIVDGKINAIVVNSGNANACTGKQGYKDTETMAGMVADCLNIDIDKILVASTGIIGHTLQMDKVSSGISCASKNLSNDLHCGLNVAKAIMTTDLFIKEEAVKVETKDYSYTIGGIAKGSGMISPGMATMLCFITTDANIPHSCLNSCLRESVDKSFNRITVDGHMSTNDMAAILANGTGLQNKEISGEQDILLFQKALDHVTLSLAKKIVKDGEGATKFVEVDIRGAVTKEDAEKIARAIANSPLVKTAINGEDYNWGRIVSAAGYAGVALDANCLKLFINEILVFNNGTPVEELRNEDTAFHEKLQNEMKSKNINICLTLGLGSESSKVWTCDFSHEYVTINAEYHT